ncbi:MAG: nucleotidyl transferase AbiEii/AbiGii toxin family protein [Cyanobium sp. M30B3]|nr:MAG: nucleotidyl transferase AbiEii/AbiGii toxin family protein [Cyanobium sp. M30B3]
MKAFCPRLEILPEGQCSLWPTLAALAPLGWVLYGGTAIALRYGHRVSVDFDFFSAQPLHRQELALALPWLASAVVLQEQPETLTLRSRDQQRRRCPGGLAPGSARHQAEGAVAAG